MPSLHVVVEDTRATLKWGTISTIILIIGVMVFNLLKPIFFPYHEPPPTVLFGKLQKVVFPPSVTNHNLSYTINNVTGSPPSFVDQVFVYPIIQPQTNLLDEQNAEDAVVAAGFKQDDQHQVQEIQLTDTKYTWVQSGQLPRQLWMDIISGQFDLTSPYASSSVVLQESTPIDQKTATEKANGLLSTLGALGDDINSDATVIQPLKIDPVTNQLVPVQSPQETQVYRFDYFQIPVLRYVGDKDKGQIYYDNPPHSTINALAIDNDPFVVEAHSHHQTIDTNTASTYPIISAQEAYKELQDGKAYIASFYQDSDEVEITNIDLGYYLGNTPQQYLMPVIVFSNPKTGFYAYVSAIQDQWLQ